MDSQIPPTALVAASVPVEQGGATEHSQPPNLADPNPTPELVMLSYDDRHYRFCYVCRKWSYWGKRECHNSDCKRYVAPQDRLRESPQFCALEATKPPWECEWPTCTENAIEEIVENLHVAEWSGQLALRMQSKRLLKTLMWQLSAMAGISGDRHR